MVYVTLRATGTVVKVITKLTPAGAAQVGTAYVVSEVSDALIRTC